MENTLHIFNSSGCHGMFLMYLLDRFSNKTPHIEALPFNNLGNSHSKEVKYSGRFNFVEPQHQKNYLGKKNLNIVKILYTDDIFYGERIMLARAADAGRDLYRLHDDISFFKDYNSEFYDNIKSLYLPKNDSVPKWVLRDAYKLGFLDIKSQGHYIKSHNELSWIKENFATVPKIFFLQVTSFFTANALIDQLKKISETFDLDLALNDKFYEIYDLFFKNNSVLNTHSHTNKIIDAVDHEKIIKIPKLDIIQEAMVYAELEKRNDFITMPLTDSFFETTKDVLDYINLFPQHYKAMNPNLPKFNGIDNPYFLHRQKTK